MIFITVKFKVRPEYTDGWLDLVDDFTQATRAEPGNLWFEWSRSVDDPKNSCSSRHSRTTPPRRTSSPIISSRP